jgi:hypothetical protein
MIDGYRMGAALPKDPGTTICAVLHHWFPLVVIDADPGSTSTLSGVTVLLPANEPVGEYVAFTALMPCVEKVALQLACPDPFSVTALHSVDVCVLPFTSTMLPVNVTVPVGVPPELLTVAVIVSEIPVFTGLVPALSEVVVELNVLLIPSVSFHPVIDTASSVLHGEPKTALQSSSASSVHVPVAATPVNWLANVAEPSVSGESAAGVLSGYGCPSAPPWLFQKESGFTLTVG